MAATITYGSVANTRHSVKHCKGKVRKTGNAIVAGNARLNKGKTRQDYIVEEALTLGAIARDAIVKPQKLYAVKGREYLVIEGRDGKLHREMISVGELVEVKPRKQRAAKVKRNECDMFKEDRPFKKLNEKRTSCSAKGHGNTATKDRSVSIQVPSSPDVDNVSGATGVVSLARNPRHRTKVSDNTLAKERRAFETSVLDWAVKKGRACLMPAEKKARRLRKAALRNSAGYRHGS